MGSDANGDFVLAVLAPENVDYRACQRVPGLSTALSAIFIDAPSGRTVVTYRDERVTAVATGDALHGAFALALAEGAGALLPQSLA